MIPFGLLGGFCDHLEIRITGLSEEGFSFRVPEKIEKAACLEICFFDFSADCYRKVQLAEKEREMKLTEETPFFFIYSVWTKNGEYREQVKRLVTDYDNYISLKLAGDDAYLSEKMVGYPAELDEVYAESFEEQKKEWFSCVGDGIQECRNTWEHKKWNITDFPEFELAITIDRPELYYDFLQKDWTRFCHDYWKNNFLEHHTLSQKRVTRIYIGNQFCHNLFPKKKLLFQVLEKALENNLAVTLAFTYIRDHLLEEIDELLQELEVWCQSREKEAGKDQEEIIVNDWAMPLLLQGKPHLKPVLGVLLNKRRKDPRIPFKKGEQKWFERNSLNAGFYRNFLEREYGIQRFEWESCGYEQQIPPGKNSLHIPFYQTNTSQYCPLGAVCETGERGRQKLAKKCPGYCAEYALLYPEHLHMIGRYNSLFGIDMRILKEEEILENYIQNGVDRVVIRAW